MTDRNEPSPCANTLLAHNELGQIHVDDDGVVSLKIQYLSLRLQADAFDALRRLVHQAATSLEPGPLEEHQALHPHAAPLCLH